MNPNNFIFSVMKNYMILLFFIFSITKLNAQLGNIKFSVYENVKMSLSTENETYYSENLFLKKENHNHDHAKEVIENFSILALNQEELTKINALKPDRLVLKLSSDEDLIITLIKYDLGLNNSYVGFSDEIKPIKGNYTGLHYRGIINDDEKSWAAVSIFNNDVQAVMSDSKGNYNLGKIKNSEDFIIYNDYNQKNKKQFTCEDYLAESFENSSTLLNNEIPILEDKELKKILSEASCPIRIYWVFDVDFSILSGYDVFNPNLTNWVDNAINNAAALFNQVQLIYQQENIPLQLEWLWFLGDNPNWNNGSSISQSFLGFGNQMHFSQYPPTFLNGNDADIAMFIDVVLGQSGGYAVVNGLCSNFSTSGGVNGGPGGINNNPTGKFGISRVENYYLNYPNYSNTLFLVAHETGHILGSRHTHWCGWSGGAIDGCASLEPNYNGTLCNVPPFTPAFSSSIMSYCSLVHGSINLSYGFGPQPGNLIRNRYLQTFNCRCGINPPVNIYEVSTAQISIFPNPAGDYFQIVGLKDEASRVEVYSLDGKLIINRPYISDKVDISNLSKGVYIIKLYSGYKTHVLRFIKDK